MKQIITIIASVVISVASFAQNKEGHIAYKVDVTADKPEMQMQVGMMQGSSLDLFFKEDNTRSEFSMGTMMKMITITNPKDDAMLLLMSGMLGTKAIKSTITEAKKQSEGAEALNVKLENETKKILGFDCKKATLTDSEGNESTFWYTEEFTVNKSGQNMLNEKIPGTPLEYVINQQGIKMTMTATKLDKKIDKKLKDLFEMKVPEGYTEVSPQDLQNMGQ